MSDREYVNSYGHSYRVEDFEMLDRIAKFLELNYPCKCPADDENCPGSYFEAQSIIDDIVLPWAIEKEW